MGCCFSRGLQTVRYLFASAVVVLAGCGGGGGTTGGGVDTIPVATSSSAPLLSIEAAYDTSGQARGTLKEGSYVYVADGASGLVVLQLSPANRFSKIGSLALTTSQGRAYSLAKRGDYLYMAARSEGVHVIDVSSPASPVRVTTIPTAGDASYLAIDQDRLFVSAGTALALFDIADPANPAALGSVTGTSVNQHLLVENNTVYLAAYTGGLRIVDVSDPAAPVILSNTRASNNAGTYYNVNAIAKKDKYVYLGGGGSGVLVYDVSDLSRPNLVNQIDLPGSAPATAPHSIVVWGNFLFVADGDAGVRVLDITLPFVPKLAGLLDTPGSVQDLFIDGLLMLAADLNSGVQLLSIFETTDKDGDGIVDGADVFPNNPAEWTDTDGDGTGNNADPDDDNDGVLDVNDAFRLNPSEWRDTDGDGVGDNADAFPIDSTEWLDSDLDGIGDNSDATHAFVYSTISATDTLGQSRGVLKSGDILYVADGTAGLRVFQIAADGSLSQIGSYSLSGNPDSSARSLRLIGNYLYIAARSDGLLVLDVSVPSSPQLAFAYDTPDRATFLTVEHDRLYLSDRHSLMIFDISAPQLPVFLGKLDTTFSTTGAQNEFEHMVVSNGVAYIAAYYSGLYIVDVSNPASPTRIASLDVAPALWAIEKNGNYLYAGGEGSGVLVFDVTDVSKPQLLTTLDLPNREVLNTTDQPPFHMSLKGDYLFVADGWNGVQVIDVSNPVSLAVANTVSVANAGGYTWDFVIDGYTLVMGNYLGGVQIVNLGNSLDLDGDSAPNYLDAFPLDSTRQ